MRMKTKTGQAILKKTMRKQFTQSQAADYKAHQSTQIISSSFKDIIRNNNRQGNNANQRETAAATWTNFQCTAKANSSNKDLSNSINEYHNRSHDNFQRTDAYTSTGTASNNIVICDLDQFDGSDNINENKGLNRNGNRDESTDRDQENNTNGNHVQQQQQPQQHKQPRICAHHNLHLHSSAVFLQIQPQLKVSPVISGEQSQQQRNSLVPPQALDNILSFNGNKNLHHPSTMSSATLPPTTVDTSELQLQKQQLELQNYRLIEFNFHLNVAFSKLCETSKSSILAGINQIEKFENSEAVRRLYDTLEHLKKVQQAVKNLSQRLNVNSLQKIKQQLTQDAFQKRRKQKYCMQIYKRILQHKIVPEIRPALDYIHHEENEQIDYIGSSSQVHEYQIGRVKQERDREYSTSLNVIRQSTDKAINNHDFQGHRGRADPRLSYQSQHLDQKFKRPSYSSYCSEFSLNKKLFQSEVNDGNIIDRGRHQMNMVEQSHYEKDRKQRQPKSRQSIARGRKPQIIHHKSSNSNELLKMLLVQASMIEQVI